MSHTLRTCEECGGELLGQRIRFCSRPCFYAWIRRTGARAGERNPAWRGGFAGYRGPSWSRQRAAALERDHRTCVECGSTTGPTVHHARPFVLFVHHEEANDLDNLVTLCRPCHSKADNAFWASSPALADAARARFPDCRLERTCERCGAIFEATSAQTRCRSCWEYRCDWCGVEFASRRRRAVRFCSKACNVGYRKSLRIHSHVCMDCGCEIAGGRVRCISCHLKDPGREVRPGRRCGRPRSDPGEA